MNGRIVKTLIKKDIKYCVKNVNLFLSLALPVIFCVIYKVVLSGVAGLDDTYILEICAIFSIGVVPTTVLPVMIAEEKEKYTLRSLMLAQVEGMEFLLGKLVVCIGLTVADAVLVFGIAGGKMENLAVYVLMVLLASAGLSFLGAVAGLTAKDQTAAGTIGAPLLLIVMLPPLFSGLNESIEKLAVLAPTTSFQTVFLSAAKGGKILSESNLMAFAVCAVWIIMGYVVFHVFYKRKGIDC